MMVGIYLYFTLLLVAFQIVAGNLMTRDIGLEATPRYFGWFGGSDKVNLVADLDGGGTKYLIKFQSKTGSIWGVRLRSNGYPPLVDDKNDYSFYPSYKNQGTFFCQNGRLYVVRLNNDNREDLACHYENGDHYGLVSGGDGVFYWIGKMETNWCRYDTYAYMLWEDINGDGISDMYCYKIKGGIAHYIKYGTNVPGKFALPPNALDGTKVGTGWCQPLHSSPGVVASEPLIFWADLDGDGIKEQICHNHYSDYQMPSSGFHVRKFNVYTSQFFHYRLPVTGCTGYSRNQIQIQDINGDGFADISCFTMATPSSVSTLLGLGNSAFEFITELGEDNDSSIEDGQDVCSYEGSQQLWASTSSSGRQDLHCIQNIRAGVKIYKRKPCRDGYSGGLCEQPICSFADVTNSVDFMRLWTKEPKDLNWDLHMTPANEFSIEQQFKNGQLEITVQFIPVSVDLYEYNLKWNSNRVSSLSSVSQDCFSPDKYTFETHRLQRADAPVGAKIEYEVQGIWRFGRDKVPNKYWLEDTYEHRPTPEVILNKFTVKYVTQFKVKAADSMGVNHVADVIVEYATSENGPWTKFVRTDGHDGIATITLENPGLPPNTESAPVYIRASKVSGEFDHDIRYCGTNRPSGSDCDEAFKGGGVVQLDLDHLPTNIPMFDIADYSAVPVKGAIQYEWNGIACGVPDVNVTLMTGMTVLSTIETDQEGKFEFTGAVTSNVWLKVEYHDHEFQGVGGVANDLLLESTGVNLDASFPVEVSIYDVTQHTLTLRSGITECKFPFLGHDITVAAHRCSNGQTDRHTKRYAMTSEMNEMEVLVPAHVFSVRYQFGDTSVPGGASITPEDVNERFSDSFLISDAPNSNQVDLTVNDDTFDFGYHLVPSITTDLEGNYAFKQFPSQCEDKIAEEKRFDIALNGNSAIARFYFFIRESYNDGSEEHICQLARPGTSMEIKSHLGVINHECDWSNVGEDDKPGCLVQFVDIPDPYDLSQNISASTIALPVGQPEYINEGETLESVYRDIELKVFNDEIWYKVREDQLTLPSVKVLIVGTEFVAADSTVSVPERIPLKLLYAPPTADSNKWSYVELATKISLQATSKLVDVESNKVGGSISAGHKFSQKTEYCTGLFGFVCWETVKVNAEVKGTAGTERVMKTFNEDSVTFNSITDELVLKTPPGQTGDAGDMALLMGVVAKYVRTRLHTFNLDTCEVDYRAETTWDKETDSLLYFSRRDTYGERNKALDTIDIMNENLSRDDLTDGEIEEYEELKMKAQAAVTQWNSLLAFWEDDMVNAESFPVPVGGVMDESSDATIDSSFPNMINIGSGVVTIKEIREDSRDDLTDYTVYTHDVSTDVDASGSGTFFGFGLTWGVKAAYTHSWNFERTERESEAITSTYTAVLHESDPEDNIAIQVFRSPFSKTFVYKTFGGITRCPHLPGTDAHQKVEVEMSELNKEDGYIVLEVSTKRMVNFASGAKQSIDLVMSLSSDAVTMPVGFTIGSATLNQPFLFTMDAGNTQSVYVFYERNLETLNRLTVTGNIKSECDSSVKAPFAFTLSWETPCAAIGWGGNLQDPLDSWVLSNAQPELKLTFTNEGDVKWDTIPQMKVSIWYLNRSRKGSQWQELPAEYYGDVSIEDLEETDSRTGISSATISINAETVSDILDNNQVYLLEARASCPEGDSRSGPRQGLVDYESPRVESWKYARSTQMLSKAIEVAGIMFSEPIDCVHDDLKATVKISSESGETVATVLCSANAYKMGVYLRVDDTPDLLRWTNSTVELTIVGVQDLSGNKFDDALGALSEEFTPAPGVFSRSFRLPLYDGELSIDLNEWTPDASVAVATQLAVTSGRALVLPEANINTFSTISEPETGLGGGALAGIVGGSVAAVVIAGVVTYRLKFKHSTVRTAVELEQGDSKLSFVPSAMELESGNAKFACDNPMFLNSPALN